MSFANQFLALCKLAKDGKGMKPGVYELPAEQDQELALIKLGTQGMRIDAAHAGAGEVPGRLLRRDVGRTRPRSGQITSPHEVGRGRRAQRGG